MDTETRDVGRENSPAIAEPAKNTKGGSTEFRIYEPLTPIRSLCSYT